MGRTTSQKITICTSCRHKGSHCRLGYELIVRLCEAIKAAGDAVAQDFEITGIARMTGCSRPCTVAYFGSRKASYVFGDIDPGEDIGNLVSYAQRQAMQDSEWGALEQKPQTRDCMALTQIPAAMIRIEETAGLAS